MFVLVLLLVQFAFSIVNCHDFKVERHPFQIGRPIERHEVRAMFRRIAIHGGFSADNLLAAIDADRAASPADI